MISTVIWDACQKSVQALVDNSQLDGVITSVLTEANIRNEVWSHMSALTTKLWILSGLMNLIILFKAEQEEERALCQTWLEFAVCYTLWFVCSQITVCDCITCTLKSVVVIISEYTWCKQSRFCHKHRCDCITCILKYLNFASCRNLAYYVLFFRCWKGCACWVLQLLTFSLDLGPVF